MVSVSVGDEDSGCLRNSSCCGWIDHEGGVGGADEESVEPAYSIFSHCSSSREQSPTSGQRLGGGRFLLWTLYLQPAESGLRLLSAGLQPRPPRAISPEVRERRLLAGL